MAGEPTVSDTQKKGRNANLRPFVKGQSGNPGGRPKRATADGRSLSEIARAYTEDAIDALVEVCNDGESDSARVSAASALLDRGWGKPLAQLGDGNGNAVDWIALLAARRDRSDAPA